MSALSEAHEVDVHLTCDAESCLVAWETIDRVSRALRDAKAAILEGDTDRAARDVTAALAITNEVEEYDYGRCAFTGGIEGYYLDDDTAEVVCPRCGALHVVPV